MTETRTTYRKSLLTAHGQISMAPEDNTPDSLTIEQAKRLHLDGGDEGRSMVIAAINWRRGGDGKWYETEVVDIVEVL